MALPVPFVAKITVAPFESGLEFVFGADPDETNRSRLSHSFTNAEALNEAAALRKALVLAHQGGACGQALREIATAGAKLFELVFPTELKVWLRRLDADFLVLELDEASCVYPWELFHDGDDFLGCRFAVGRRIWNGSTKRPHRSPRPSSGFSILLLSDPTGDLEFARREAETLFRLFEKDNRLTPDWINGKILCAQATEWLGGVHAVHFAGHGEPPNRESSGGAWRFSDGSLSTREIAAHLDSGATAPLLVFSNACHSGVVSDPNLEGADRPPQGTSCLAKVLIEAGCEHFIGPIHKTRDTDSCEFSRVFYQHVLDGSPIGRALQRARLENRAQSQDHEIVWMQYVLYGDPTVGLFGDVLLLPEFKTLVLAGSGNGNGTPEIGGSLDRKIDALLSAFPDGQRVESTRDSALFAFPRPSDAVRFAALLQETMGWAEENGKGLAVAIHGGEVLLRVDESSGAILALEGEALDIVSCLNLMALPGQILVARPVFDHARSFLRNHELTKGGKVCWLDHGAYKLLAREDILGICEVGIEGHAPRVAPADSSLAKRHAFQDQDPVLGWRPALDQEIPTSPNWVLLEKLGEGGFGEVWRAKNKRSSETRVLKFCFRAEKVRSLKREASLLRVLQEQIAECDSIVRVKGFYFEEPPYYIEMEDVSGLDLAAWWDRWSPEIEIPQALRLDIVAQVADALQIAHNAGVIHRDVKPSNILVIGEPGAPENIRIKLADFGIGQIVSRDAISISNLDGFTETFSATEIASHSGSRLYTAPEVQVGRGSSIRSDLYSLGVVLYQMLVGDLRQPLTTDWRKAVEDPLLGEDLERCLAGDPSLRFASADDLASALRSVDTRRQQRLERMDAERRANRRRRISMAATAVAGVLIALTAALSLGLVQAKRATWIAQREEYYSKMALANRHITEGNLTVGRQILIDSPPSFRHWEWNWLMSRCSLDQMALHHEAPVQCLEVSADGKRGYTGCADGKVTVWDLETGNELQSLRPLSAGVVDLALAESHLLLAARTLGVARIYDLRTGDVIRDIPEPNRFFGQIAFNPTTGELAAANSLSEIRVFSPMSGESVLSLKGHEGWLTDLDYSPDGQLLASTSTDRTLRIWNATTGEMIHRIQASNSSQEAVAFSHDGERLAVSGGGVYIRPRRNFQEIETVLDEAFTVYSLDFSPADDFLIGADRWVSRTWSLKEMREVSTRTNGASQARFCLGGDAFVASMNDQGAKVFDIRRHPSNVVLHSSPPPYGSQSFCFSPDGSLVATGGKDCIVSIWDRETGREVQQLQHLSAVNSLAFTPQGDRLLAGCRDSTASLWSLKDGNRLRVFRGHRDQALSVDVSPDGEKVVTASYDRTARIWGLESGKTFQEIAPGGGALTLASFSPEGGWILLGDMDGNVGIWDVETGQLKLRLMGAAGEITGGVWSPDGAWIIVSSSDGFIRKWNRSGGKELLRGKGGKGVLLFPDGNRLITQGMVVDAITFREIVTLPDLFAPFDVSHDGQWVGGLTHGGNCVVLPSFLGGLVGSESSDLNSLELKVEKRKREFWKEMRNKGGFPIPPHEPPEIKGITGQWDFNRGDLSATVGRSLGYYDFDERGMMETGTQFGTTRSFGIPDIGGEPAAVMKFPECASREGIQMFSGAGPNGGGAFTNQYSILMDILFPSTSSDRPRALFNKNSRNQESADFLVSATNSIGVDSTFHGKILPDSWHRIVCVVNVSGQPTGWMDKYIDGTRVGVQSLSQSLDARWALAPGTRGEWTLLFSDREGRTAEGYVNSIQFRNYAMSHEEVALLGGPTAQGIPCPVSPGKGVDGAVAQGSAGGVKEAGAHPRQDELGGERVSGQWDFESGDLRATHGRDLQYFDADGDGSAAGKVAFGKSSSFGLPLQGTRDENVMRISGFDPGEGIKLFSGALPNFGWGRVNRYSIVMDILLPSESLGKVIPIFNTNPLNADDAELVVSETHAICIEGNCPVTLKPDTWHRLGIVVRMEPDRVPQLILYLNGVFVSKFDLNQGVDGRWSAPDGTWGQWMLLFADPGGNAGPVYVDCVQVRNYAISPGELDQLGHAGVEPISSAGPSPPVTVWSPFQN